MNLACAGTSLRRASFVRTSSTPRSETLCLRLYSCFVDGPGTGFGNKVSIQDVALVRIAQGTGKMFAFEEDDAVRPVLLPFSSFPVHDVS